MLKAYDGQEALKVLNANDVDLLVIDVMMPAPGRDPGDAEDPGREQYSHYHPFCKVGRCG